MYVVLFFLLKARWTFWNNCGGSLVKLAILKSIDARFSSGLAIRITMTNRNPILWKNKRKREKIGSKNASSKDKTYFVGKKSLQIKNRYKCKCILRIQQSLWQI